MKILPGEHTCASALACGEQEAVLFRHRHRAEYLPGSPDILLAVAVERGPDDAVRIAVTERVADACQGDRRPHADVAHFAAALGVAVIELHRPLLLEPVVVPKPWGREHWYTGVEARGQSSVVGEGGRIPLPWLLSIAGEAVLGGADLGLLKILDPLPDPVYGDLYFELHDTKREVYVVTGIDRASWPDGVGAIRFGFDPVVRASHDSETAFRAAYLAAVENYREIRRRIDSFEESWRAREGYAPNQPLAVAVSRRWRAALSPELRLAERNGRAAMERFTQLRPLRVGDVVRVPPRLPHALQHGVRTVEFQTPVYERRILSFAQKVLTQEHWDTRDAVADMLLDPPDAEDFPVLATGPGMRRERIAQFDDFAVERLLLAPGARTDAAGDRHLLAMVVAGTIAFGDRVCGPESAVLMPAQCRRRGLGNVGEEAATVLFSAPCQVGAGRASG